MKAWRGLLAVAAVLSLGRPAAADSDCKSVHADLVEDRTTVGCEVPGTTCFIGEVDGNHGLRGTTRFRADSSAAGPPTSPGFISYSGKFEYFTDRGNLTMRETGLARPATGSPDDGVTAAFQRIVDATGEFTGATGYFFVSGFNIAGHVVTKVTGTLCLP